MAKGNEATWSWFLRSLWLKENKRCDESTHLLGRVAGTLLLYRSLKFFAELIDDPDFAITLRITDTKTKPSRFYCSTNRGHR